MQLATRGADRNDWAGAYAEVIAQQPTLLRNAKPIVAGFSATTDAIHLVDRDALRAILTAPSTRAVSSPGLSEALRTLGEWLRAGRDGEIIVDDESADSQLEQLIGPAERLQCGGTSVQAAWSWAAMGLSPLLALRNRSSRQLAATPRGVLLAAEDGATVLAERAAPSTEAVVPSNHVLEFPAGLEGDGFALPRALRVMLIFARKRLQLDEHFAAVAPRFASGGVGLASGFNGLGDRSDEQVEAASHLVRGWKRSGARLVHLELADYSSRAELDRILSVCADSVDSIGMNASEFSALIDASGNVEESASEFGESHGFSRVVIHGDRWAMSVHRRDPDVESLALRAGCLAAANRASGDAPRARWSVPAGAELARDLPVDRTLPGGRRVTVVASPFLPRPRSTIGLGDTFVSGDLLVQANHV